FQSFVQFDQFLFFIHRIVIRQSFVSSQTFFYYISYRTFLLITKIQRFVDLVSANQVSDVVNEFSNVSFSGSFAKCKKSVNTKNDNHQEERDKKRYNHTSFVDNSHEIFRMSVGCTAFKIAG